MTTDLVTNTVAPMAPIPAMAPLQAAPASTGSPMDFGKLVNQQLEAAGSHAGLPPQSLAQVMAPYAAAAAPAHAPEAAPLPNRVVDTAAPAYPA
ncbi:MAG: hypothetical protein JWM80_4373, partial [Cyanobacteria bacterium RYN_339]|nr:hypothetical protein [Cyanobacteria bacterium RYN_339]